MVLQMMVMHSDFVILAEDLTCYRAGTCPQDSKRTPPQGQPAFFINTRSGRITIRAASDFVKKRHARVSQALNRRSTRLELVPPKPKELDKKVSKLVSRRLAAILIFALCSSGFSKLMFGAINPPSIMSME